MGERHFADLARIGRALRLQQAERKKVDALIVQTETDLLVHKGALDAWHARLFLPSASASETVKARLEELDALARQSTVLNDARQAKANHQAVVDDIEARAAQLAILVGEPAPVSVYDFADRLRKRLVLSRESGQERSTLIRDQNRAQQQKRQAETELEQQGAVLARLCSAAGIIVLEEGWKLRRSPYFRARIDDWLMTVRKKNGVVIFITPDLSLSYDEKSDSLVKQPVTFLYFACDRADERDYRRVFGLSQREFELVREWEPEERLALVKHGNDSVVVRTALDTPELARFLPVLSGNEGNVRLMREIMREVNSQDPDIWLPIFMEKAK